MNLVNKMKNIPILLIAFFLLSCKNNPKNEVLKQSKEILPSVLDTIKSDETSTIHKNEDCYNYLTELVRSSDFPFENIKKEKVNLLIDEDNGELIRAKIFFNTDGTGTIGWIEYHLKERKLYNSSANLEEPEEIKYDINWAKKFEKCKGINANIISQNSNTNSLENIYSQAKLVNLPNQYNYEFISDEKDFIQVPKELYYIFEFEHYSNFKIAKLPSLNSIKPLLIIIYDESGQSEMFIVTVNNKYEIIDKLKLYDSEDIEAESISTTYKINNEYKIQVKEAKLVGSGSKVIEKNVKIKNYKINVDGRIVVE
jgi:hypothetical protein